MAVVSTVDLSLRRQVCPVIYDKKSKDCDDIVEYGFKQVVKKVGDGEEDFIVQDKCVELSRVNRQAWIAKDAPDVGILNILEKVRRSGDVTLFNQTHSIFEDSGEVDSLGRPLGKIQDYTNAPESIGEALRSVQSGANSFEALKSIFGDVSFEKLATMSAEEINQYLTAFISKNQPQVEEKGEEK